MSPSSRVNRVRVWWWRWWRRGRGGPGRKASRQLISAPLSSLKGSGLLCRGACGSPRAAFGFHVAAVSSPVPAKCHRCRDSAASRPVPRHGSATEAALEGAGLVGAVGKAKKLLFLAQACLVWKRSSLQGICIENSHWGKFFKVVCELDLACCPLPGHPICLLGRRWEEAGAILGVVPDIPGSVGRGYTVKTHLWLWQDLQGTFIPVPRSERVCKVRARSVVMQVRHHCPLPHPGMTGPGIKHCQVTLGGLWQ